MIKTLTANQNYFCFKEREHLVTYDTTNDYNWIVYLEYTNIVVRVLSIRSSVIHGFVTEPWFSRHVRVSCEHAASSVLEPWALSSAYLVSCWSVVFGSRHSCLEFQFRVRVRTLALRFLSLWECMVSSSLDCAFSCPRVFCCVARSSCFYRLHAFMLYLVLCGTQLVYFIGCVLPCCYVLCGHVGYEFSH